MGLSSSMIRPVAVPDSPQLGIPRGLVLPGCLGTHAECLSATSLPWGQTPRPPGCQLAVPLTVPEAAGPSQLSRWPPGHVVGDLHSHAQLRPGLTGTSQSSAPLLSVAAPGALSKRPDGSGFGELTAILLCLTPKLGKEINDVDFLISTPIPSSPPRAGWA